MVGGLAWKAYALALLQAAVLLAGCAAAGDADGDGGGTRVAATGRLRVVAVDARVQPLPGVEVTASLAGAAPDVATTDAEGQAEFAELAPGTYSVGAAKDGYLSLQTLVQVVAGNDDPPIVPLAMEFIEGAVPYANVIVWDGYIGCAFSYGNLCSAPAQGGFDVIGDSSAHLFWSEYLDVGRVPDVVQAEAVWQPTLPSSSELGPIFGWSTPPEWAVFQYGGTFTSFSTPSPMFHRLTGEELGEVGIGVETGLVLEFYSGDPGGLPAGLTLNQPIRAILHNFYGYLPSDDWRFVTDGAPPGP